MWASLEALAKANGPRHELQKKDNPHYMGAFPTIVQIVQGRSFHYLHDIERFRTPTSAPLSEPVCTAMRDLQLLCVVAVNQGISLRFPENPLQMVPNGGRMMRMKKDTWGWKKTDGWNWEKVLDDPTCKLKSGCSPFTLFTLYHML